MHLEARGTEAIHARRMLDEALAYCSAKMGTAVEKSLLKSGDARATGFFRYKLAQEIASFLGKMDELVNEVYLYPDEHFEEEIPLTLPLTLIVHVQRRTAALDAVIAGIENGLLEEYQRILEPVGGVSCVTNVCLVNEQEMCQRTGLAAVVGSVHTPALCVWRREED